MALSPSSEITTLLCDLDGTLVRMKRRGLELRFMLRAIWRFAGAIPPWRFRRAFWEAAERMQSHGTDRTNYRVLLDSLARHARVSADELDERARAFIARDFPTLGDRFEPVPGARETVLLARQLGYRVVIATNPVWPLTAVRWRLIWGGLGDIPFALITHSESMTRCKPSPEYYLELLGRLGARPRECLMIGNDPRKDLPAREVGIRTFLVDPPPSALGDARLDAWGSFENLRRWLRASAAARPIVCESKV